MTLYKVVGDCSTSTEALNLTPGDSHSVGVHWTDHHWLWSSCTWEKGALLGKNSGAQWTQFIITV